MSVPDAAWPGERSRLVSLLKEPGCQTALGGRPLAFEFQARVGGKFPRQRFAEFRPKAGGCRRPGPWAANGIPRAWMPTGECLRRAEPARGFRPA